MKKIISIIGSETFLHEDLKSMFQDISEKDLIVKSVNDGEIIADNKGAEIVIKFGKFNVENISNDFKTEVISIRNKFAHAVLETDENGREFFFNKNDQLDFDSDLCKKIRRDILKHKKNLDDLENALNHNN